MPYIKFRTIMHRAIPGSSTSINEMDKLFVLLFGTHRLAYWNLESVPVFRMCISNLYLGFKRAKKPVSCCCYEGEHTMRYNSEELNIGAEQSPKSRHYLFIFKGIGNCTCTNFPNVEDCHLIHDSKSFLKISSGAAKGNHIDLSRECRNRGGLKGLPTLPPPFCPNMSIPYREDFPQKQNFLYSQDSVPY